MRVIRSFRKLLSISMIVLVLLMSMSFSNAIASQAWAKPLSLESTQGKVAQSTKEAVRAYHDLQDETQRMRAGAKSDQRAARGIEERMTSNREAMNNSNPELREVKDAKKTKKGFFQKEQ